jgi:hypothetical protein
MVKSTFELFTDSKNIAKKTLLTTNDGSWETHKVVSFVF